MAKSYSKILISTLLILQLLLWLPGWLSPARGDDPLRIHQPLLESHALNLPLNPLRKPTNIWKPEESRWPEYYIDPTLDYALTKVLPQSFRKTLDLDLGFDRWIGLATGKADCFFSTTSREGAAAVFFNPALVFTGAKETASVAVGARGLLTDRIAVGINVFHDWERPRASNECFLRTAGMGIEVSALPGYHSDLTFSANGYIPLNERQRAIESGATLVREALPVGADASLKLLLPPVVDRLDTTLEAKWHGFQGENISSSGYELSVGVSSRDGMFSVKGKREEEFGGVAKESVTAGINLCFDWEKAMELRNPFFAPYQLNTQRFDRDLRQSLTAKLGRRPPLPMDRSLHNLALQARVEGDTVFYRGGLAHLINTPVTVQTSSSPWQDRGEVVTDGKGMFRGRISLAPGKYRLRIIHKPSGRSTAEQYVVIEDPGETSLARADGDPAVNQRGGEGRTQTMASSARKK